jgi:hypothetical protein
VADVKTGHTPGPWRVKGVDRFDAEIIAADGTHVVCFGHDYDEGGSICAAYPPMETGQTEWEKGVDAECMANARLLAAAPESLAALKGLRYVGVCWCEFAIGNPMYRDHSELCKQIAALVAKVEEAAQKQETP